MTDPSRRPGADEPDRDESDLDEPNRGEPIDDEPTYVGARTCSAADLRARILAATQARPVVVAIDGRSAGGKSTLAARLADGEPGWAVVATDDVAWWHDFFAWDDLLRDGVLDPARRGEAVSYRPLAWNERGRSGAITVPAGTEVLLVEGVGASRLSLREHLDLALWVHTPHDVQMKRERQRIETGHVSADLSREWLAAEAEFLAADRPWSRADLVVSGTADTDPARQDLTILEPPA